VCSLVSGALGTRLRSSGTGVGAAHAARRCPCPSGGE